VLIAAEYTLATGVPACRLPAGHIDVAVEDDRAVREQRLRQRLTRADQVPAAEAAGWLPSAFSEAS